MWLEGNHQWLKNGYSEMEYESEEEHV